MTRMSLTAAVEIVNGRPMLTINGEPTTEFWCYGDPNAIGDFKASGLRICQFHVPFPSWWSGPETYDLEPTDRKIAEFLSIHPDVLLIPRVNFGYEGEAWWGRTHPDELAVGRDLEGRAVDYAAIRARPVDCWFSSGSEVWTREATAAMSAFVEHCESRHSSRILGYQIGGGISAEWFRWWNFVPGVYEDYSGVAREAFRRFLRDRYGSDAALQAAWGRADVTLQTAEVPPPRRLHEPLLTFFRDPARERDVIDWLECLSHGNSSQIMALAASAKRACGGRKLVGTFYGYFWPHWNTQSAARSGHMDLRRILDCREIDFISSPYHYDNRNRAGFHHSQTVPQTIEHAGKLHVDEVDTHTHLADLVKSADCPIELPRTSAESCALLRRDAATVLGTAGTGWWMDLHSDRWYDDAPIQSEVRRLQALAKQSRTWSVEDHAEVALVVDDRSYAYSSLWSPLNQFFSSMGRQLEWSDCGFPIDTVMPFELARRKAYRVYLFLNCWRVEAQRRREILERVRRPGVTAIWSYGCGFYNGASWGEEAVSQLVGMRVRMLQDPQPPVVRLQSSAHPLVALGPDSGGQVEYGATLKSDRSRLLICDRARTFEWNGAAGPTLIVDDPAASVLGVHAEGGKPGLAMVERDGWRSIYSAAPLLPGWLLRRIAAQTGARLYTDTRAQVFHRGPLVSVYKPGGGRVTVTAPPGTQIRPLGYDAAGDRWAPQVGAAPASTLSAEFGVDETRFFITD